MQIFAITRYIEKLEKDGKTVSKDLIFDYQIHINNICIELSILLDLSSLDYTSDNPNRLFNDANKFEKKYNVQNGVFNI